MSGSPGPVRLEAYIDGVGALGPGFADWPSLRQMLAGQRAYIPVRTDIPTPSLLPPAERRRVDRVVKVAMTAGLEAAVAARADVSALRTVFTSSGGDGQNCHEICQSLASSTRELSPTRFHNSVHNAAAGYWGIATGSMASSNVLCAYDASFAAGLLETLVELIETEDRVLLIAYDIDYPDPMHPFRPIPDAFGVALVCSSRQGAESIARIGVEMTPASPEPLEEPFEVMRTQIPAARSLPMLRLLAREGGTTRIEALDGRSLAVEVALCA